MDWKDLGSYWEGSGNDDDNELMITKPDESDENDLLEAGILSFQNLVNCKNCKINKRLYDIAKFNPYYLISIDGSGDKLDDGSEDDDIEKGNKFIIR